MDHQFSFSVSRRKLRLMLAMAVAVAVLAPVAVIAAGGTFVDDDSSIFEGNIEWLVANGITSGCGPDTYCPEDNVTRGQMAAFMQRLATKKVVDAATAISADTATTADTAISADTATTADTAGDAETLGGLTPADLMANKPIGVGFYGSGSLAGSGVTGVTSPQTGVYCVAIDPALGVTYDDIVVQVAVEWGSSSGFDLFAFWDAALFECGSDEFEVRTYQFSYDGDGDVNNVELNGDVAWTYSMYHRPDVVGPTFAVEGGSTNNSDQ